MKDWSDWQIIRRQVAIGGRIVDENDQPVPGVQVTITAMPKVFKVWMQGAISAAQTDWDELGERPDRRLSRSDGIYFFLDLPEGKYTLHAIDPRSGNHAETSIAVGWDKKGNIDMGQADFTLSSS